MCGGSGGSKGGGGGGGQNGPIPTKQQIESTFPGTYDQVANVHEILSRLEHGTNTKSAALTQLRDDARRIQQMKAKSGALGNDTSRYDKLAAGVKWTQNYIKSRDWSQDARLKRNMPTGFKD